MALGKYDDDYKKQTLSDANRVPDGKYTLRVALVEYEEKENADMITLTFDIIDPGYDGEKARQRFYISDTSTQKNIVYTLRSLKYFVVQGCDVRDEDFNFSMFEQPKYRIYFRGFVMNAKLETTKKVVKGDEKTYKNWSYFEFVSAPDKADGDSGANYDEDVAPPPMDEDDGFGPAPNIQEEVDMSDVPDIDDDPFPGKLPGQ